MNPEITDAIAQKRHAVFITDITPADAQYLISLNTENRTIRRKAVDRLADEMRNARWHNTHQGMALSAAGRLIDGQHRCHAIINSGQTISTQLTVGLPETAFAYIDLGVNRNLADRMAMGRPKADVLSFAIKILYNADKSSLHLADLVAPILLPEMDKLLGAYPSYSKGITTAPLRLAAVGMLLEASAVQEQYVLDTYSSLCRGDFSRFNPAMSAFYRQKTTRNLDRKDLFLRASEMFDGRNAEKPYIKLGAANKRIADLKNKIARRVDGSELVGRSSLLEPEPMPKGFVPPAGDLIVASEKIIRDHGSASVSLLERKLGVGWRKASLIMDELVERNVVIKTTYAGSGRASYALPHVY